MDWVVVEVVVGLSFLFFLLSVVTAAINEAIAGVFKLRARTLEKGITNLVTGSSRPEGGAGLEIVSEIYRSPLVAGYGEGQSKPSYLASRSFRNALFSVTGLLETTSDPTDPLRADQIKREVEEAIGELPNEHLKSSLLTIWHSVNHDATEFRAGVERWFDRGMERVSGWYKRQAQVIVFVLGILTAVVLNANALTAAEHLWADEGLRDGLVAQIENQQDDVEGAEALDRLETMSFPVGWAEANRPDDVGGWTAALGGWLLTGFAITFGAPFWFDVLGKFTNLRAAGKKPESTLLPAPKETEVSAVHLTVATDTPAPATPSLTTP